MIRVRRCRACDAAMLVDLTHCPSCGAKITASTDSVPTLKRQFPRQPLSLALRYCSDSLEVQAKSRDLSLGGAFVSTSHRDRMGTECELHLEGGRFAVRGRVARVAERGESEEAGLGIEFTEVGPEARQWLESLLGLASRRASKVS